MHRYLVVANQTLAGDHLEQELRRRVGDGPCSFHVLVPATPLNDQGLSWTEGEALSVARERLERALDRFGRLGADVSGEVGDERPLDAIDDVLRTQSVDEIVLSTLPAGASRWLKMDLPARVRRRFDGPVTHVEAT